MEKQITVSELQKQIDEVNRQLEQVEDKLVQESAARERAEQDL